MWNERYANDQYIYGTEPNTFLVEHAGLLTGPVLSLGEGEGRNAVYMASFGLQVLGVDGSEVGLAKAQRLAAIKEVAIETQVVDLSTYQPPSNTFGAVVSIFAHLPSTIRRTLYPLVKQSLKLGGIFLLEAYSKAQIDHDTGGPKDLDMLMSCADLENAFPNCDVILSQEIQRDVVEGEYHSGTASVVQFICRRRA